MHEAFAYCILENSKKSGGEGVKEEREDCGTRFAAMRDICLFVLSDLLTAFERWHV